MECFEKCLKSIICELSVLGLVVIPFTSSPRRKSPNISLAQGENFNGDFFSDSRVGRDGFVIMDCYDTLLIAHSLPLLGLIVPMFKQLTCGQVSLCSAEVLSKENLVGGGVAGVI